MNWSEKLVYGLDRHCSETKGLEDDNIKHDFSCVPKPENSDVLSCYCRRQSCH